MRHYHIVIARPNNEAQKCIVKYRSRCRAKRLLGNNGYVVHIVPALYTMSTDEMSRKRFLLSAARNPLQMTCLTTTATRRVRKLTVYKRRGENSAHGGSGVCGRPEYGYTL